MLSPILEIFVVWHPNDTRGVEIAKVIFDHFMHGNSFSGVIGGGIQVSMRSIGWEYVGGSPRPIYSAYRSTPNRIDPAKYVAVVPLLGNELASNVEKLNSDWHQYVKSIIEAQVAFPDHFGVFPYQLSQGVTDGTQLGRLIGHYQFVGGTPHTMLQEESRENMLCRDLTQGIAQLVSPDYMDRLTVFISHTKRHSHNEGEDVEALVDLVREVIGRTRLEEFFDASDLQPGTDWDAVIRSKSGTSAMLAIRTDLYSSREWCQREIVIAKIQGMPVIMMDAIGYGEERGSFLMDHVPRVAVRKSQDQWQRKDVYRALNLLVDECLKRALWKRQKEMTHLIPDLDIEWWAPHAPEPITLSHWINGYLESGKAAASREDDIRILHPDPPLGPEEREVLLSYARSTKIGRGIDIMTPRQLATRGV